MSDHPDISIRIAEPQDVEVIHRMIVALARDTGAEDKANSTPADFLQFGFGDEALFER